jgi:hypothetical protein
LFVDEFFFDIEKHLLTRSLKMANEKNAKPSGNGEGPELLSIAQQFTGLPMGSLIGGPLNAAAQANHQMACDQVGYLLSTCFITKTNKAGETTRTPVTIDMVLERPVIHSNGKSEVAAKTVIKLPLLTIIPLNSLAVDEVDIKFEMEVSSAFSVDRAKEEKESTEAETDLTATGRIGPFRVEIKGHVKHDSSTSNSENSHYEKKNSAKYSVGVHASQLPLPPGIGIIIQSYASCITPIEVAD